MTCTDARIQCRLRGDPQGRGEVEQRRIQLPECAPDARGARVCWLAAFLVATLTTPLHAGAPTAPNRACEPQGVRVQVLGSGGPELAGGRASSSYLVWIDGKARALVDLGSGAVLRFGETGANIADLDVILFTHLHVDHSADLPALIKASFFQDRDRVLPVYGPTGNRLMPSTVTFGREMFNSPRGAFRYRGSFVNPRTRDERDGGGH